MSEGDVEMKVSPATEQQDVKEPDAGAEEVKGDEVKQDSAPDDEVKTSDDAAAAEEGGAAGGAAKDHSDAPVDDTACAAYDLRNPTDFTWKGVSYAVKDKKASKAAGSVVYKNILTEVSGAVEPGEILMVIGPSGCGKTTLLDALGDRVSSGRLSGSILVNGQSRGKNFRNQMSYTPADISLMGVLTTRETLDFSAQFAGVQDPKEREEFVARVSTNLGMNTCLDTPVGNVFKKGLSGGQKRRLLAGVEMFSSPSIMMCDGLTNGLDSAAAYGIVKHLKSLTRCGLALVLTMNQPSAEVLALSDKLLVLWEGQTIYFGKTSEFAEYLDAEGFPVPDNYNIADHVLDLVADDFEGEDSRGPALVNMFKESAHNASLMKRLDKYEQHRSADIKSLVSVARQPHPTDDGPAYDTSVWRQFIILAKRNMLDQLRNPGMLWIRIAMYTMLCLMIGGMFWNIGNTSPTVLQRMSLLFYVQAFLCFMELAVIPFFLENRAVFVRERANRHYAPGPYVLASFVTAAPGVFIIALLSSVLVYFMVDMQSGGFGVFLLDLFLSLLASEAIVLFTSALVPAAILGMAGVAGLFGAFMLVQGFFITRSQMSPIWIWLHYIALHSYSFRVFMHNEFNGLTLDAPFYGNSGDVVLASMDMDNVKVGAELTYIGIYVVLFQFAFYLALKYIHTGRR